MEIFPKFKFRPRLLGEASAYDLLSQIEDENGFAVHSVNLPEHEYKRWGEADFVVVSGAGLILLEVKGGNVAVAGRVWRYENARGNAIESSEGPARQAISAAVALEKMLGKCLGRRIRVRWGVVFPLCAFNRRMEELPPERLADKRTCVSVEAFARWLANIPFDHYSPQEAALSYDEIEKIRSVLLPEFSASSSLGLSVVGVGSGVIKLTRQQYHILESLDANPRLTITGGAGTGKTELAVLCARSELASGRKPAILTCGSPLTRNLRDRLVGSGIHVSDRDMPSGCDVLIVDEGQDLAQPDLISEIFASLPGGLEGGRWRWFMDPNLQYMDCRPDQDTINRLRRNSVSVELGHNVRSTREIVQTVQVFLASDIGLSAIDGYGVKVGFHDARDTQSEAVMIVELIDALFSEGARPADIAVLGPGGEKGAVASIVIQAREGVLRPLAADGRFPSAAYGVVASISAFRGLEAKFVILTDLDLAVGTKEFERDLYIGMTRASVALHVFASMNVSEALKGLLQRNS